MKIKDHAEMVLKRDAKKGPYTPRLSAEGMALAEAMEYAIAQAEKRIDSRMRQAHYDASPSLKAYAPAAQ